MINELRQQTKNKMQVEAQIKLVLDINWNANFDLIFIPEIKFK